MASWGLSWDGFWCFNSSTVYKLTFSLFGCWAFSTYSECNKNWALTSQSVAGCVRSSFLEAIVGSPKADASKIDPWLKGPAENHRATEGAPCSFVNVACLMFALLGGDSTSWGGDSTSCPVHLGVSKGWHCLGWKQTTHRHIALAFWSTCLRITSYHVWHHMTMTEALNLPGWVALWTLNLGDVVSSLHSFGFAVTGGSRRPRAVEGAHAFDLQLGEQFGFTWKKCTMYPSVFLNRPGNRYSLWMFTDIILYNS